MIKLGEKQVLTIERMKEFGAYLNDEEKAQESVLLPRKNLPDGAKPGMEVEVFIYRDSKDRLIATTAEPKVTLGKIAMLTVKEVGNIGAFLDWGLEKDLLLPFKEQTARVHEGRSYLIALYIDKSNRLCGTMRIYDYLSAESPYKKDDRIEGTIYQVNEDFGAFVAVDNKYHGLIPTKNLFAHYTPGDSVEARVSNVREDGKLELSTREKVHIQMDMDAKIVMDLLDSYEGVLPFTEKADPAVIEREAAMSKAAFKRAIGRLLKSKHIEIIDGKIKKVQE